MANNPLAMSELIARVRPRSGALATTPARAASASARLVGESRLPPAQVAAIGKEIASMPVTSRNKIMTALSNRKVQIGGVAVTVGALLGLTETELGQQLLTASQQELQELLGLFDSVDSVAGDQMASAYNKILEAQSSASLDRNYDVESSLGVPMANVPGIGLSGDAQNARQALVLAARDLFRLGLSLDNILFLQFGLQNLSPDDWNALADEVRFLDRF